MNKYIYILTLLFSLTACQLDEWHYVDFTQVPTTDAGMFRVTKQKTTNLQELVFADDIFPSPHPSTSLPATGDNSIQAPQRASSTNVNQIAQELLRFGQTTTAIELSGVYESIDLDGNPILLSGKVILPAKQAIKRYILVSHYTIASNAEAPSNTFSLEGLLVNLGYALIIPDYLGYGITADPITSRFVDI